MFKPQYKQLINMDGIELKPSDMHKIRSIITALSFTFSAVASCFPQLLKCDTDMIPYYCIVPYLQCCYAMLVTSNVIHDYWKCYINIVTQTCLRFYWYIHTLPRALRALRIVQSNLSLLCYNLLQYTMYIQISRNVILWFLQLTWQSQIF